MSPRKVTLSDNKKSPTENTVRLPLTRTMMNANPAEGNSLFCPRCGSALLLAGEMPGEVFCAGHWGTVYSRTETSLVEPELVSLDVGNKNMPLKARHVAILAYLADLTGSAEAGEIRDATGLPDTAKVSDALSGLRARGFVERWLPKGKVRIGWMYSATSAGCMYRTKHTRLEAVA